MRTRRAAAQAAALSLSLALPAAARSGVIPLPADTVAGRGSFSVDPTTRVSVPRGDRDAESAARYLVESWTRTNGLTLPVTTSVAGVDRPRTHTIAFRRRRGFGPEGYGLKVTPRRITVSASSAAGLYYGAVTLWQLLPPGGSTGQIPAQTIRDAPAYAWRGLMLDSARHFQSPAFICSMIDWMAWHKLNVLHWHLTDDQGWRLEIRKFPRLTSVGAWRIDPDGTRYGGFYTQDEVRDIVRYAAARHVQIVPEIDMPGHATAAIAAYPALGVGDGALAVSARWGVHTHLFNLEPSTFGFLEDVLAEVIELFPSPTVHIGGDEAVKDEWNASSQVRTRAEQLGIRNSDALQAYFMQRFGRYLAAHGRRMIGWDEILQPELEKDAIVMSWHGVAGAHTAAVAGNDTILTPWPTLYFDHRQSTLPTEPPGRMRVVSLEDVYRFEPRDATLSEDQRHHVLGIQANIWTEHIQTEERVQWVALPRAAALAEVAWSAPERRRWPDFLERLGPMVARYRAFGLNYADSAFASAAQNSRNAGGAVSRPNQAQAAQRRDSHHLELCSDGIGLLLEPAGRGEHSGGAAGTPLAVDIMNPCWIDRGVDLSAGPRVIAAVAPLPFNYEIGADAAKIRVGDARTAEGELEIHVDGCDTPARVLLPLAPAASARGVTTLPAQRLPAVAGRHDLCLRFARPRLDPLWAIDWVEVGE